MGKNWHQVVQDENKEVLVAYITSYCGACKELEPILDELAKTVHEDMIIATFNGDANEAEGLVRPKGFPAIVFYPKDKKEGIVYTGASREFTDLMTWLEEKSPTYNPAYASMSAFGDTVEEL